MQVKDRTSTNFHHTLSAQSQLQNYCT